ncbi:MAG: hypothetical protein ACI8QF_000998 [Limisphaerales bacterium]|jgi:hypothetical protein
MAALFPKFDAPIRRGDSLMKVTSHLTLFLWLIPLCLNLAAQAPSIAALEPAAVAPGRSVEVVVRGAGLGSIADVWTSFDANVEQVGDEAPTDGKSATLRFTLPTDAQVGVGAIRIATRGGVTSPYLLMIDDLPSAPRVAAGGAFDQARELPWPAAVDGACDDSHSRFYRLKLSAGKRVAIECVAQRIGSKLDPLMRLFDRDGRQVAQSEDVAGIGADARFSFAAKVSGGFVLEVRDSLYEKSEAHRYRLRIGGFPFATLPFPLGSEPGASVTTTVLGTELDGVESVKLKVSDRSLRQRVGVPSSKGSGSGFVRMVADALKDGVEAEPNNTPEQATKIQLPLAINGRFEKNADRDFYEFEAKKNEQWAFVGQTRSLGSPSALFVQLYDAKGKLLKEADVTKSNEAGITNRFSADGKYRLLIEELTRTGGPAHGYRMEIQPWRPGFDLSVSVDKVVAKAGASFELKVAARRDKGFDAPITLSIEGAWAGTKLAANVIEKKKSETKLKVTLPSGIEPGQWRHIRIVGKAESGGAIEATAGTESALKKLFPETPFPPAELIGLIAVGIAAD